MKVNIDASLRSHRFRSSILLVCFTVFSQLMAFSQATLKVSGIVNLGTGAADLSGTTIQVKGSKGGVTTDATGHFTITVQQNATLVISHIGFKTVELKANSSDISVSLESADNTLEQVTVSYGRQRKRDITGSVSKVDASALRDVPAAEFGQKLYGKVAGLQLNQATGVPGQGMYFRIRGAASLSGGNQPLVVIDGLPVTGDVVNLVNPEDIESFSVLKDAGATALYGSRAANGVILITTRSGKVGKTTVTANAYYGLQSVPQRGRPKMMNAHEFATYMKGYYEDRITYENWTNPVTNTKVVPAEYANPDAYGKGTDWYSAILRTSPVQSYSVNLSSGNEKLSSSTTFSYFDQQGVLYNTYIKRYSIRNNLEYRPIDRIKVGLNVSPIWQIDHNTRGGSLGLDGNRQIVSGATISSPLINVRNADGSWVYKTNSYGMLTTPNYRMQEEIMNVQQNNLNLLSNAYVDVEIIKGLHAKSTINADLVIQDYNAYYGTLYSGFNSAPPRPAASSSAASSSNNSTNILNENTLNYSKKVGEHNIEALAGYSYQKYSQNYRSINGTGFANDAVPWISGATTTTGSSNKQAWSLASAFARLNYDFMGRYFISGTIRRDGSSRFGEFKKYGTFPSVSAGWVLSDESFFPKSDALSFAKVRGSYGLTGNFNVGNYTQVSLLSGTNYVFGGTTTIGESITSLGNKNLTWETSKQLNIGLELTLLKNRLTFSYDYYNKRTENMLSTLQIPAASGFSTISYNVGTFRMWGHEFQLSSKNITGGDFTWSTDFNISFNDNKVISLINNTPIGGTGKYNDYNRTAVGHHIGELYGYIFEGLYKDAADFAKSPKEATSAIGTAKMKDVDGNDTINISDRTFIGNPSPKYIFGITNTFGYKNWDLNIIAGGQVGNKIMNTNLQNLQNLDGVFNINKDMQYRWRSEANPGNGKVPRTLSNTTELYRTTNTNWVFSGDFLSIRNIALGYTFQKKDLRYIKSLRIYASAQNAFMFTKYPGQNPEVNDTKDNQNTAGQDIGSYPVVRTFMIGANINF